MTNNTSGTTTSGSGSTGTRGNGFGGASGVSGTNDYVIATPSVGCLQSDPTDCPPGSAIVSVLAGATQTVSIIFTSNDARPITGFAVTGTLGSLPAGWSGPATFVCATVSTGNSCVLNLTFAPKAASSGIQMLTLNYEFVDNASLARTEFSLTIPYTATANAQNNVLAAASPTGQINAVVGASQSVSVNFTTDDGNAATGFLLTTDPTALPVGWSSTVTSLTCDVVSTGNGCELPLTYAPSAAGSGTLTLGYSYTDNAGMPGIGSINIPYSSTSNDNVAAVASPSGQINAAIANTGGQPVPVAVEFNTDDGRPASNLFVTSDLKTLPAGWTSAKSTFSCGSVSTGNGCLLPLTYAPTALASGTFTLTYVYEDDSGAAKGGLLNVNYAATTNDNVMYTPSPAGQITAIAADTSQAVTVTFNTNDSRQATELQLTPSSVAALPASWSTTPAFTCPALSTGTECQLTLTYTPTVVESGTVSLNYTYLDNDNMTKTGTVSLPYRSTADDYLVATANPSPVNAVTGVPTAVTVTFTTNDGYPGSNLSVDLTGLSGGWASASAPTFSCSSVSGGTPCLLTLTYTPTAATAGTQTLGLPFTFTNDSLVVQTGTAAVLYTATAPGP